MADSFDPYHKWLGIPPKDQPPSHYRLLALELYESDPDVIESAADQRMAHVRTFQTGQNSATSQRILNELSAAKICLLNPQKKAEYDEKLRASLGPGSKSVPPIPVRRDSPLAPQADMRKQTLDVPLPQAGPLPQAEPQASQPHLPIVIPEPITASPYHKRAARKKSVWQQPGLISAVSVVVVLLVLAMYWLTSGGSSPAPVVANKTPNVSTAKSPSRPVDSIKASSEKSSRQTSKQPPPDVPPAPAFDASKPDSEVIEAKLGTGDKSVAAIEFTPLAPKEEAPPPRLASGPIDVASSDGPRAGLLKIFEDEPEFVSALALGDNGSKVELDGNEAYSGKASVKVTPSQRFAEMLPGLNVKIRKNPSASDEYRYLRFAWKKRGGGQIWLQLHYPSNWHRYRAGPNYYGAWPGVGVADEIPTEFVVVTRDLAADFGEFTFNGLALTPFDGECAWFDHIYLAQTLNGFDGIEDSPQLAGEPVDLLKRIDVKRDAQWGEWRMESGVLLAPATPNSRLQVPVVPPDEYQLTLVAKGEPITRDIVLGLPVGDHQALLILDGWSGTPSALQLIDGKPGTDNESTVKQRVLADGETAIVCEVRKDGIDVTCNGKSVIHWRGDRSRLSSDRDVPDPKHVYLYSWSTPFRATRFEMAPLTSETQRVPSVPPAGPDRRPAPIAVKGRPINLLKQLDTARDALKGNWTISNGALISPSDDFACLALPAVPFEEYRLTVKAERLQGIDTFSVCLPIGRHQVVAAIDAWEGKFSGLETIDGKQCYENESSREGHVLEPGRSYNLVYTVRGRSIRVDANGKTIIDWSGDPASLAPIAIFKAPDPKQFAIGTAHSSVFSISRIELSALSEPKAGDPKPSDSSLADAISERDKDSRQAVPDDDELKKARQEFQKKYGARLSAVAKSPDQKRALAVDLIQKADVTGHADGATYTALRQATDLAESAGDLDVAWQATDLLAKRFAVSGVALRQESLMEVAKAAKSPEQCALLAEAACRLMVSALGAKDAAAVKKTASQAANLAKRTKDKAVQKMVMARTNDAGKLAAELDDVAAAGETLKSSPDDAKANFTVGHYELCAGDWQLALPKLAKSDDAAWRKLAADELALDSQLLPGARPTRQVQQSLATRQLAVADAWWLRADDEPWPGRHYLRMRAGRWYNRARSSLVADDRIRADNRLKMLLATDEGLPELELLKVGNAESQGEMVRVEPGRQLQTPVDYGGPIAVTLVARATSSNFQLHSHRIGWNWNFNMEPNHWHVIRYVITPALRTASVDGLLVFTDAPKTIHTFRDSPVTIFVGNNDEAVEIKKLLIEALD